jgi:hypothetical protein
MSSHEPTQRHLFLVRIWLEPADAGRTQWRGQVEHVGAGEKMYFASLNSLNDFISLRLQSFARFAGNEPIEEG